MKQFRVTLIIHGKRTQVLLGGANTADVISTAQKMFKKHQVITAVEVK